MKSKRFFWHVVYADGTELFEVNGDNIDLKQPMRLIEWVPEDRSEKAYSVVIGDGDRPIIKKRNYLSLGR